MAKFAQLAALQGFQIMRRAPRCRQSRAEVAVEIVNNGETSCETHLERVEKLGTSFDKRDVNCQATVRASGIDLEVVAIRARSSSIELYLHFSSVHVQSSNETTTSNSGSDELELAVKRMACCYTMARSWLTSEKCRWYPLLLPIKLERTWCLIDHAIVLFSEYRSFSHQSAN